MDVAKVSAKDAMALRQRTGLPILECKQAIADADGDMTKAEAILKERAKGKMDARTDRVAGEGRVAAFIDGGKAAIIEVRSETDFTAKNPAFQTMAADIAKIAAAGPAGEVAATPAITAKIDEVRITTRENASYARGFAFNGGAFGAYVHHDGKTGSLVQFSGPVTPEVAKGVCQHIVAHVPAPIAVDEGDMPAAVVAEKRSEAVKEAEASGKPPQIAEKMAIGKMRKFFEETTLLGQNYVVDDSKKVRDLLPAGIKVLSFVRMPLGGDVIRATAKG
ncbi:MAG: translation elongation factor Ts [Phycisphaerae bacterium]|nr:translation elongation factor Ts [Phycisphaerae bacterium]